MQIQLNWEENAVHIVDAVVYPYPDLQRLWLRVAVSAFAEYPDLDVHVVDPAGHEVARLAVIELHDQELSHTLHLRRPQANAVYHLTLRLTRGEVLDQKTLDFPLTFVDPDSARST
ncbi:MAG: hypothetical protein HZY76_09720 [Anaerolineae bacterium]|nr:MAG: hypothetical protein HZY76_09720 [Anaerolineae bacterium]